MFILPVYIIFIVFEFLRKIMFRRKKKASKEDYDINNEENELNELDDNSLDEQNDKFDDFDEEFDEDDFDDLFKDDKKQPSNFEKTKEFYVKKEDLINEIRKYNESKKTSPDGKGIISEELRYYDHEDLYKIFNASKILWLQLSRRICRRRCNKMHYTCH